MRSSRAIGTTATLIAVLAASACSGGSSGGSTDSSTSASSTHVSQGIASGESTPPQTTTSSTSKSPTTKAKPTSKGTAAGAPGVPEVARQHTQAGAKAFVSHYIAVINKSGLHPKKNPLKDISSPGCKTCAEWTEALNILVKNSEHYDGALFEKPQGIRVLEISPKTKHLFFSMKQTDANVRSESGKITFPGDPYVNKVVFELDWTTDGWRTSEVQKNES